MKTKIQEKDDMLLITFPEKTGKEIIEECNNKVGGGKLVWSTWMNTEDFYTKEKSRPGKRWVSKELYGLGRDWNACKAVAEDNGAEMLNFAETLWFLKTYVENFKEYPDNLNWSWTSSRSAGGLLVGVGDFDSGGVFVCRGYPDGSGSRLGVRFSRSVSLLGAKPDQGVANGDEPWGLNLERAIEIVKKEGYIIYKEI